MPWKKTGYSSRRRTNRSWFTRSKNPAKKDADQPVDSDQHEDTDSGEDARAECAENFASVVDEFKDEHTMEAVSKTLLVCIISFRTSRVELE